MRHIARESLIRSFTVERKILVAVDDSIHSRHAVQYAVRMSSVVKGVAWTLFHVQPPIVIFSIWRPKRKGFLLCIS